MSLAEWVYTDVLRPRLLKKLANSVLLRLIPEVVHFGSATVYVDPNDPVVSGALTLNVFEPSERHFFSQYCRGDMVFLDIGANVGLYTALAIHYLSHRGYILTLEPHPVSFGFLKRNIEVNLPARGKGSPRVRALQVAAAAESGTATLYLNPENKGDNRLYRGTYQGRQERWESIAVDTRRVDDLLAEDKIEEVNFVKIDIQGYEQKAVRGLHKTLADSRRVILMSEFWPKGLREAGGDAFAYLQELTGLGFQIFELKECPRGQLVLLRDWQALIERLPNRRYTNIVATKGYSLIG